MLWGAGYRYQMDRLVNVNPPALAFIPADQDLRYAHAFVEDDIALGERLSLILGFKLEHNIYTEFEYLPTVRMAWKPTANQLLWGAVSRAVRAPARIDRELFVPGIQPHVVLAGGPNFDSEIAHVAELGYRAQPMGGLSYSITAFVHDDDHLRSIEPTPSGPQFENRIESTTFGAESWGALRVNPMWRVSAGLVLQDHQLRTDESADNGASLGNDPESWWTIRNEFDFGPRVELDAWVRQVGALPDPHVPTYTTLDARLGWRVVPELELAVTGHDLFGPGHTEWGVPGARPEFERSVLFSLRWEP
jgi:iron complex outermembrane receptor protein